jgi:hypothetical protein
MGLQNREGGKYFTIMGGKFSVRVPEGTPKAVTRVNKKGVTVHEVFYDSFTGKLVAIKTQDSPYGKNWVFSFKDGAEVYNLQLSYSNSYATNLLKMLPNIDLTKEMKVQPAEKIDADGKKKSSLFINQEGNSIKHAYTKDVPNGMPPMEQIVVKGLPQWDDTKRIEFLHAMVVRDILPKLPKDESVTASPADEALAVDDFDAKKEAEDLDF